MRLFILTFIALFFLGTLTAQWSHDPEMNAQLTNDPDANEWVNKILPDHEGGWYILYHHHKINNIDVRLARVDEEGEITWDVTVHDETDTGSRYPDMISDGQGGVIIKWQDNRLETSTNIYVNRIDKNGSLLWGDDAVMVGISEGSEACAKIVTDGRGGAIVSFFDDDPPGMEIKGLYVHHVDDEGQTGWRTFIAGSMGPNNGCETGSSNYDICSDGQGGAYTFQLAGDPNNPTQNQLRGMRVDSNGVKMWPDEIVSIASISWPVGMLISSTMHGLANPRALLNKNGTVNVLWVDNPGAFDPETPRHTRSQQINDEGDILWTLEGIMLNDEQESSYTTHAVSDASGNIYFTFHDGDNYWLQKVTSSGARPWGNGMIFRDQTFGVIPPLLLTSCQDIIVGYDYAPPTEFPDILVRRFDPDGQAVWNPAELRISSDDRRQRDPLLAINNEDKLIAVWADETSTEQIDLYMQGFNKAGEVGSVTSGIKTILTQSMAVAPNPTTGKVDLLLDTNSTGGRISLVDGMGKVVENLFVVDGVREYQLDLSHLPNGMYYCKLENQGTQWIGKIVLSK